MLGFDLSTLHLEMIGNPLERCQTLLSPWTLAFSTLDDDHIDDDVVHYDDLMRVGSTYH
jgi:hypothetical protein